MRLILAIAGSLSISLASSKAAITEISELWGLTVGSEANEVHQLDITVKVLIRDLDWKQIWIQDEHGKILFLPFNSNSPIAVETGEIYRIRGTMIPSQGISADRVSLTPVEDSGNATANDTAANDITDDFENLGDYHETWVNLTGYVDMVIHHDASHSEYRIILGDKRIDCYIFNKRMDPISIVEGQFATLEGILSVTANRANNTETYALHCSGAHAARPAETVTDRYFNLESTAIEKIAKLPRDTKTRIVGTLYAHEPGKSIVVQDETGITRIANAQTFRLKAGSTVEVVGLSSSEDFRPTLKQAIARPVFAEVAPHRINLIEQIQRHKTSNHDNSSFAQADVSGVVTFVSPDRTYFFLTDMSGTIKVEMEPDEYRQLGFKSAVSLTGEIAEAASSKYLRATNIRVFGHVEVPEASPSTFEKAHVGFDDFQWVEIQGNLRSSRVNGDWLEIDLTVPQGEFRAKLPIHSVSTPAFAPTPGSSLLVRGILNPERLDDGSLGGFSLLVPDLEQIAVKFSAPSDPFENQAYPLSSLYKSRAPYLSQAPVSVTGIILHNTENGSLVITDGEYSIKVLTLESHDALLGDTVEAVGLPGRYGPRAIIKDAHVRVTGKGVVKEPVDLPYSGQFDSRLDLKLVRAEGVLIDLARTRDGLLLTIGSNDYTLEARISKDQLAASIPLWEVGSRVNITGIYNLTYDALGEPQGLYLEIRAPSDLVILEPPSWWTPRRMRITAFGSFAFVLIGVSWSITLRRKVREQTSLIREKIKKEAQLESFNQQIIENASDFIFTLDLEGLFTTFNPSGEKLTGYSRDESAGISIYSLLEKRDRLLVGMGLKRQDSKLEHTSTTNLITRKSGDKLWVETNFRFIRDNDQVIGALGVMRDISERKQIELELTRAKETAEANTRSKSAFLANMSHELRTPMNGVIGMANILLETDMSQEQRSYADTIRDSAETLLGILNDILDFSKAEAGKLTLSPQEVDINESIAQAISLLKTNANDKGIQLEFSPNKKLPAALLCDGSRLRQVLLNIIGNAIKFTEAGKVSVKPKLLDQDEKIATLRIEILDTGIGISEEAIPHLFTPFEQADASHSRRFGGTGLGLSICKQIVEQMGGKLDVQSKPGEGSVFSFTLVLDKIDGVDKAPTTKAGNAQSKQIWEGPPLRILIAEDTPVNQRVTKLQLKRLGLDADIANNGKEALQAVEKTGYDLILMDCQMPEMDGFEATRRLRLDDRFKDLHIVALTANAMDGDKKRCYEAGMDDFVSKPTKPASLLAALNRIRRLKVEG